MQRKVSNPRIQHDAVTSWWQTVSGLKESAKLFSQNAVYSLYNAYIREGAKALGAKQLKYHTEPEMTATGTCPYCQPFEGRIYNLGQFLPVVPRHPWCVCWWETLWPEDWKPPYLV